jgi:protein-S-isoprenylcysteine O-methyltransferase Ste14
MRLIPASSTQGALRGSLLHWFRLLTDHIAPGALFLVVGIVQLQAAIAYWHGQGIAEGLDTFSLSWLIAHKLFGAVFYFLVAILFAVRAPRKGPRAGLLATGVALAGAFVFSLYGLLPTVDPSVERMIPAVVLMALGTALAVVSLLFLGRFFGVLPEARGIATHGPYSRVRHPLYLAEIIASVGLILPTLSLWTVALLVVFIGLQYWRAILEERALTATLPEYADYARRTWRIIPGVH